MAGMAIASCVSMQTAQPGRWEWRTFGSDFGTAEALVQEYPARVRTSDQVYIVSL